MRSHHVTGQSRPQFTLPCYCHSWPCTPIQGLLQEGAPAENSEDPRPSCIFLSSALGVFAFLWQAKLTKRGGSWIWCPSHKPPSPGLLCLDFQGLSAHLVSLVAVLASRGGLWGVFSISDLYQSLAKAPQCIFNVIKNSVFTMKDAFRCSQPSHFPTPTPLPAGLPPLNPSSRNSGYHGFVVWLLTNPPSPPWIKKSFYFPGDLLSYFKDSLMVEL